MTNPRNSTNMGRNVGAFASLQRQSDDECSRFRTIFSQYLNARSKTTRRDLPDGDMDLATDAEEEAVWAMIRTRTAHHWQIRHKLDVLQELLDVGGEWYDRRDRMLLASIKEDVEALGLTNRAESLAGL